MEIFRGLVKQSERNKLVKIGRVIWLSGFLLYHCRNQRLLTSWGNLTWKQTKCKSGLVCKNWLILPVLFVCIEKLRFVFTFDFRRTLLWEKIDDEGCSSPLLLSLLSVMQAFFQSMCSYTQLWNCLQPCNDTGTIVLFYI